MSTWAVVYHLRQAEGREQRIARRYVVNVPDDATKSDVQFALDAAGFAPVEFGIEWANHSVVTREDGQEIEERGEVETGTWAELVKAGSTDRRVTLRMSPSLHRRVTAAAAAASESINTWCVEALERLLTETAGDRAGRPGEMEYAARAVRVFTFAQEEARRMRHNYLGTEHLLLGLIRVEEGVAGRVLTHLGITLEKARKAVEYIIGPGDTEPTGEVGLTPRSKKVIELARDSARKLNSPLVGTEHLLLGIVREGEGIAAGVIEALGVSKEQIRISIMQVIVQSGIQEVASGATRAESPAPKEESAAPEEKPEPQEEAEAPKETP